MPKIQFAQNKRTPIQVDSNANLMFSLLSKNVPVASSCHGEGVCSKCRIQILQGAENLSPATEQEKLLSERNSLRSNERINCQTRILGDIIIDTNYW